MDISIQSQGFEVTPALGSYIRKELVRQLAKSRDRIMSVSVFLSDINGPRGGADKKVLVRVQLASGTAIKLQRVDADLYSAVAVIARRVRHTVKRAVRRSERQDRALLRQLRRFPEELQAS